MKLVPGFRTAELVVALVAGCVHVIDVIDGHLLSILSISFGRKVFR
jgi:hypothetical protein